MGWLSMQSLRGFAGPRQYLDNQFTFTRETVRATVLRSALVKMRTYYAAVEVLQPRQERKVAGVLCLVRYNPRDREGFIFAYKDTDETVGPYEAECPPAILDLLTPTENTLALAWRERCRASIARRAAKPRLRNGWTLVFEQPITFTDGAVHARLQVVIDPHRPRRVLLSPPEGSRLYRIGNLDARRFRVEPTA